MIASLERHADVAREVAKKLAMIYIASGEIPFERAANLATATVKEMAKMYRSQISKGGLKNSIGVGKTAWHHFGEYFRFHYTGGTDTKKGIFALGYDSRHWILSGDKEIPWRLLLRTHKTSSELPTHVENKIRRRKMRDGFSWVYFDKKKDYHRDYTFIRIPDKELKQLPSENAPNYVPELAKVIFKFLEELFKKS